MQRIELHSEGTRLVLRWPFHCCWPLYHVVLPACSVGQEIDSSCACFWHAFSYHWRSGIPYCRTGISRGKRLPILTTTAFSGLLCCCWSRWNFVPLVYTLGEMLQTSSTWSVFSWHVFACHRHSGKPYRRTCISKGQFLPILTRTVLSGIPYCWWSRCHLSPLAYTLGEKLQPSSSWSVFSWHVLSCHWHSEIPCYRTRISKEQSYLLLNTREFSRPLCCWWSRYHFCLLSCTLVDLQTSSSWGVYSWHAFS